MTFNSDHHKLNQKLQDRGAESGQLKFCDSSSPYAGPPYLVVLFCKHINLSQELAAYPASRTMYICIIFLMLLPRSLRLVDRTLILSSATGNAEVLS